jgi:hypothetical protein
MARAALQVPGRFVRIGKYRFREGVSLRSAPRIVLDRAARRNVASFPCRTAAHGDLIRARRRATYWAFAAGARRGIGWRPPDITE